MEKKYCVYVHTNKVNGKRYVGITSTNPKIRWSNGNGYRNNVLFYRAINKYSWDEFTHEVVKTGLSNEEACDLEIKLISEWETVNPQKGYNLDKGGNGSNRITEETRKKISDGVKRYFEQHPEAKEANAERLRKMPHSGKNFEKYRKEYPDYAKVHGEWLKSFYAKNPEKVCKSREKCREYYNKHPEARALKSEQTRRYFDEHPEARQHNARKTREYYQNPDVKKRKSEERKRFFAEHPEKKTTKAVAQYSTDGMMIATFTSAREADKCTGVSYKKISAAVTGKQRTAGGYIWRYSNELQNKTI